MAFGFTRERGTGRGYVNVDNPLFAPGQRLSRRQYDKYVEQIGQRMHLPAGPQAIVEAENRLARIRNALAERAAALDDRERELLEREAALAERERERTETGYARRAAQRRGQDRYNLRLELYVRREREAGRTLTKRQAALEPAFRAINEQWKWRKNASPDANQERRWKAMEALGGLRVYQETSAEVIGYRAPYRYRAPSRNRARTWKSRSRGR
jgi:hypothetical protein